MKKGGAAHGFTVLDIVDLEELKARGVWARHETGAELFHVCNDDSENLFAFAFATPGEDSTGAAHILEHSVLCGSQRYPLKDAFLTLAQGSLQTFLNAWTFPDKTVYPASSVNERDYYNLMAVYADAVFRPLLSECAFMQEGCRLERGKRGLAYTGVVYNEMKGAYSSMDTYAGLWSVKAVMPGTPYAFESGGDPDVIPDLSWEALKAFHRRAYSPGNCRIFLAGNIPTVQQMEYLNRVCLAGLAPGAALPPVNRAVPWTEHRVLRVPCPGGGETGPQAFLSWLCSDSADTSETIALAALTEILLGHDGSPLTRALTESGLGEDLCPSSGLEADLRETVFCAGLRGMHAERNGGRWDGAAYTKLEALILGELGRLARDGIPAEEIEAALLSMEFSNREIRRSHGPFSLVWLRRSLRGWLAGAKPWEAMLVLPNLAELKRRLKQDGRYFEGLIRRYLLDNPHRALVAVEPEEDYLDKKEAALAAALKEKEKAMTDAEHKALQEKTGTFERYQAEADSPQALASIPHLSRGDLVPRRDIIPVEFHVLSGSSGGVPVMAHPLFTNGISYADFAFPVDTLEPEDYIWLPFFARAIVSMGVDGMDYGEMSGLLARTAGGFYAALETGTPAPRDDVPHSGGDGEPAVAAPDLAGRDWIIYRLKALNEKLAPSLDLAFRLISGADFSDLRRLRDLVVEMKNDCDASLAPGGHLYAAGRSGRACSRSKAVDELWNGLGQIPFAHELAALDTAEISARLTAIRDALAARSGLFLHLTVPPAAAASALSGFGPPHAANPRCADGAFFRERERECDGNGAEVWASASLQIGFAAASLPAAPYGSREQAAELVLSHELSTGALWESIRMKGGAYGASARPDSLEGVFSLSTYRDPGPVRSLKAFPGILAGRGDCLPDGDSHEKALIGTFARETAPRTPSAKGFGGFLRYLYGITEEHRYRRLQHIVSLEAGELQAAARRLAEASGLASSPQSGGFPGRPVVITGTAAAEEAARALGTSVRMLPI